MKTAAAGILAAALLAGCGAPAPTGDVRFDPLAFFDGTARSRGTIVTAFVSRRNFTARFEGRRETDRIVLDERFRFPEGPRLQRWRLEALGNGRYAGTVETEGPDGTLHPPEPVVGTTSERGVEFSYEGFAPGGDTRLRFRHRMSRQADGTVANRVRVSKFGLPLATADVVFEKVPQAAK